MYYGNRRARNIPKTRGTAMPVRYHDAVIIIIIVIIIVCLLRREQRRTAV